MCLYNIDIITICCVIGLLYFIKLVNTIIREAKEDKIKEQIIIELKARGVKIEDLN